MPELDLYPRTVRERIFILPIACSEPLSVLGTSGCQFTQSLGPGEPIHSLWIMTKGAAAMAAAVAIGTHCAIKTVFERLPSCKESAILFLISQRLYYNTGNRITL
jgi:hypothetical protein